MARSVDKTPDFIKSIPVWKAMEENTLIAYEMNGQPLPHFNGFPARIVVPGWTGTYWMKHRHSIKAVTKPASGFWMNPAYRIPHGKFPVVARFPQETAANTPITEMVVNSLITSPADGAQGAKPARRHSRRHRLGRRLRHPRGRNIDRRRQDLGFRHARARISAASPSGPGASSRRQDEARTPSWPARPTASARARPPS